MQTQQQEQQKNNQQQIGGGPTVILKMNDSVVQQLSTVGEYRNLQFATNKHFFNYK